MSDHILSLVSACVGATKAAKLLSLIEDCEGQQATTEIEVAEGTFDDTASFDRETSADRRSITLSL